MKLGLLQIACGLLIVSSFRVSAATYYVNPNGTNPVPPFNGWSIAATNIQDAVDASTNGDLIIVTNGIYRSGGRIVYNALTNRVVVDKAVIVQSVNGPAVTVIEGYQVPGTTNGDGAIRCVYMTNGAMLIGFTLTNGATQTNWNSFKEYAGGGVYCESRSEVVSNCILIGNAAYSGGGASGGSLIDCVLAGNTSGWEGGAAGGSILNQCTITNNRAGNGGGTIGGILTNCVLTGNVAWKWGGGAAVSQLIHCVLTNNQATSGGGSWSSLLISCVLSGNVATDTNYGGGGAWNGQIYNCLLIGNSAPNGGGAGNASLLNCTIVNNSASNNGGGTFGCGVCNSVVYYNIAPTNADASSTSPRFSCLNPLPTGIPTFNNITNAPLFVDPDHGGYQLQSNSPCVNSGDNGYVITATDLDGNPRIVGGTVDIGAYELQTPVSRISYAWLQQYGLPITTNSNTGDPDNDDMNNYQEWMAGTDPTDPLSLLEMLNPVPTNNPPGLILSWQSVSNRTYFLQCSTNLAAPPAFSTIQSNLTGLPGTTSYTDTNAVGNGPFFYRVGVQP